MTSSVARLLLALALLMGWQLALVHPLKHVDGQGSYVHLGNHVPDRQSDSPDDLCDVIAGLTACIGAAQLACAPACCGEASPVRRDAGLRLAAAAPPFLSQGPPAFSRT
jgi:hypothetical protein